MIPSFPVEFSIPTYNADSIVYIEDGNTIHGKIGKRRKKFCQPSGESGESTAPISIYDEELDSAIDIINVYHRESLFSTF